MPLAWSDLQGDHNILLYGMGVEGQASARLLDTRGIAFRVAESLSARQAEDELTHGPTLVIKSPGIPPSDPAMVVFAGDTRCTITTGLELWLADRQVSGRIVLVTGTKGKSTTSAMLGHMLRGLGFDVVVGGNIGLPPWDLKVVDSEPDYWVIETSSYQASGLSISAPLVVLTSLSGDHLPWHGGQQAYYRDKLSVTSKPGAKLTIANGRSHELRDNAGLIGGAIRWVDPCVAEYDRIADSVGVLGKHNVMNAALCLAAIEELGIAKDDETLLSVLGTFTGLPHRLQVVERIGEVRFVDDGLSTNALSAIAALKSFDDTPLAIILGGEDRGIDYAPLVTCLLDRKSQVSIVTIPDSGPRIAAEIRQADAANEVRLHSADSLSEGVALAYEEMSGSGGVVLLSPAAPSFGRFRNFEERSACFVAAANRIRKELGEPVEE